MEKIKKGFNLKIISLIIGASFLTTTLYSYPTLEDCLRVPVGEGYYQILKGYFRELNSKRESEKAEETIRSFAEEYVGSGNLNAAQLLLEVRCSRPDSSKWAWLTVMYIANAVIENSKKKPLEHLRPFLELLRPFIKNLEHNIHGDNEKNEIARDALNSIVWAFVEVGSKSDLPWMKDLIKKLVKEIGYYEVKDIIIGINEAVVRYGTDKDVEYCLDIFMDLPDSAEAQYAIYDMVLRIAEYGKDEHLLPLLGLLKLRVSTTPFNEAPSKMYWNETVGTIGLAFLAKGSTDDVEAYVKLYLNPLPDEEIRFVTNHIARMIVKHEVSANCIRPYLVVLVPRIRSDETRRDAVLYLASWIAKEGSPKDVENYLNALDFQDEVNGKKNIRRLIVFMDNNYRGRKLEVLKAFLGHPAIKSLYNGAGIGDIIKKIEKMANLLKKNRMIRKQNQTANAL